MQSEAYLFELRPLFFLQEKLDEKIMGNLDFEIDEDTIKEIQLKKILAFRVEVGELLNALRLHKYWSKKGSMERESVADEYADGLHFLLSIGGDKKVKDYAYRGIYINEITEKDLVWLFDQLMTMPWQQLKKDDFLLGLEMYLRLGELLGFNFEEIRQAYAKKNIENHARQESGY